MFMFYFTIANYIFILPLAAMFVGRARVGAKYLNRFKWKTIVGKHLSISSAICFNCTELAVS